MSLPRDKLTQTEMVAIVGHEKEVTRLKELAEVHQNAAGDILRLALAARGKSHTTHIIAPDGTIREKPQGVPDG